MKTLKVFRSHSSGDTGLLRQPLAPWWTRYFPEENTSFSSSCAFTVNSWFITHLRGRREGRKERQRQTQGRFDVKEAQQIATDPYPFRTVSDKPPSERRRLRPREGRWLPMRQEAERAGMESQASRCSASTLLPHTWRAAP